MSRTAYTITHPSGLKVRCAANKRYIVVAVSTIVRDSHGNLLGTPVRKAIVQLRTNSFTTALDKFSTLHGLEPVVYDTVSRRVSARPSLQTLPPDTPRPQFGVKGNFTGEALLNSLGGDHTEA